MPEDDYRRAARCPACKLTPGLCICAELPRIALPVRIEIVRHPRERGSQSNTGRLVHRVFENSSLRDYDEVRRLEAAAVWDPGTDYRVLFPEHGAPAVSAETFAGERPRALIVFDGRWRQARRMSTRVPGVRALPFVTLPLSSPRWPIRRPRMSGQLSTGEAVALALELLGYGEDVGPFLDCLATFAARVLRIRGRRTRWAASVGPVGSPLPADTSSPGKTL